LRRALKGAFAALSLVLAMLVPPVSKTQPAHADTTISTIAWPNTPLPYSTIYAHGDGSFTVGPINAACGAYSSTTPTDVTIGADGATTDTVYGAAGNWALCPSYMRTAAGDDRTTYVVEQQTVSPYAQRIVALHGGATLWTHTFGSGCGSPSQIFDPTLGFDGNLYMDVAWSGSSTCTGVVKLAGINPATGRLIFTTTLPGSQSAVQNGLAGSEVMPYSNGVAVVNNGANVYYVGYDGTLDSSKTFSPSVPSNTQPLGATITADGRAYLSTQRYVASTNSYEKHLYYKDALSSTIGEVLFPAGAGLSSMLYTTPQDGVVATWGLSSATYLGYFNHVGAEVYEKNLSVDSSGGLSSSSNPKLSFAVDSAGNVIVERVVSSNTSPYDQNVYVDSFDSSGIQTRLFDSSASFGTSGRDIFTAAINSINPQGVGDGKIYLILCHQIYASGSLPSTCTSSDNPQIVVIPAPGRFDYPRTTAFTAIDSLTRYVALGDSYSSGEANTPFIGVTDGGNSGDGCDRSESKAYPELLASALAFRLQAFVACSGATSDEFYTGMKGEPSQLTSLNTSTDIVTMTAGGDDAGFADFAQECVLGTCDSASSQYAYTMDEINNYLQGNVELLLSRVRAAAPNATIVVVGYPEVVSGSSGSCPTYISNGEQAAIDTVITALNNKLGAAVSDVGSGFQFIDSTMNGSPFDGHDLCSADSYFTGLSAPPQFSFHPNVEGQIAYEELIANLI